MNDMVQKVLKGQKVDFKKIEQVVKKNIKDAKKTINLKSVNQLAKTIDVLAGSQNPAEIIKNLKQADNELQAVNREIDLSISKKIKTLLDSYKSLVKIGIADKSK